jgi:Zn-dependent M32 family carboxypeptidase
MKTNILTQNKLINNVKIKFKSIIDGILNRYDNYVYTKQLERFFKNNRTVLEKLKDKVNLAIACLNKNISKYNTNGILDGRPHSIWLDSLIKGQLRRNKRNRVK